MVNLDDARLHNSRKSETALTAIKARQIPAPVYSPGLSPSDFFFLVGMLKERMSGTSHSSPGELISAISELIASFPKDQPVSIDKKLDEAPQLGN
jgi:hypothetical protein